MIGGGECVPFMLTQPTRMPAPRPMEHRWGERVELNCAARLLLQDGTSFEGRVRNASISGALIATGGRAPPYAALSVALIPGIDERRRTLELPACVVRMARGSLAVEWRDMAVPTLIALLREVGGDVALLRSESATA